MTHSLQPTSSSNVPKTISIFYYHLLLFLFKFNESCLGGSFPNLVTHGWCDIYIRPWWWCLFIVMRNLTFTIINIIIFVVFWWGMVLLPFPVVLRPYHILIIGVCCCWDKADSCWHVTLFLSCCFKVFFAFLLILLSTGASVFSDKYIVH